VRLLVATGISLCLLVGLSLWLATRSWFLVWQIGPQLERRLGGDVHIGSAAYLRGGTFVFRDVILRSRDHEGPAAQVLRIGRALVGVDLSRLLVGEVKVEQIRLEQVLLRVSEDINRPGVFSFMALKPGWSDDVDRVILPPGVQVRNAVVEIGVHDGAKYMLRGQQRVAGQLAPAAESEHWYNLWFGEIDEHGVGLGDEGVLITGRWNAATNEYIGRIDGLPLDERTYRMSPQLARLWWDRMDLKGRVARVDVRWKAGEQFGVSLTVDKVSLTLPIETGGLWARYRLGKIEPASSRPRMHVESGTIRLEGDKLMLEDLVGELVGTDTETDLVGVPYRVDVTIHSLPELDWENRQEWMDRVLATAPFDMTFRMDEFGLGQKAGEDPPAVELPLVVIRVLEQFTLTGWLLTTEVNVSRAPPTIDAQGTVVPQPIRSAGRAYIREASGAFKHFPYPLKQVEAYLQFDNEKLTIHYLNAMGSGDASFGLTGEILFPGKDPSISLRLTANDVALDEHLRSALNAVQGTVFDALLHRPSFESLRAAGLLADEATIEAMREELSDSQAALAKVEADHDAADPAQLRELKRLREEVEDLERTITASSFQLGGTLDLDLTLRRPRGPNQLPEMTGTIILHSIGLLYENFPYPISIAGGRLDWQDDKITIVPGLHGPRLPVTTPGGGKGWISGEIGLPTVDGRREVRPHLTFEVAGDEVNELVYAAIPLSPDERDQLPDAGAWPGGTLTRPARLLKGIGLTGLLHHSGSIDADENGRLQYDFSVELSNGKAKPSGQVIQDVGGQGVRWPSGLDLEDVQCSLRVTPSAIRLAKITGRIADGRLTAEGMVDLTADPIESSFDVHLDDLALERVIVDLLPGAGEGRARELWDRFRPQGTFDARMRFRAVGDEIEPLVMQVEPNDIRIVIDDQSVLLSRTGGELSIGSGRVTCKDLTLELTSDGRREGVLVLDGSYGIADDAGDMRLEGSWTDGQFDSPLIIEVLNMIGAGDYANRYREYQPSGTFDAAFSYASAQDDRPQTYTVTVGPRTVAVNVDGTPVVVQFDPGAKVTITPDRLEVAGMTGHHAGGTFDLAGTVVLDPLIKADLRVGYVGRIRSREAQALLPRRISEALDRIDFQDGEPSHVRGSLRLEQVEVDGELGLSFDFDGVVEADGASFSPGIEFSQISGNFELSAHGEPGEMPAVEIRAHADRMRAHGYQLTNVEAIGVLSADGKSLEIPSLRADAYGGVVFAEASFGVAPNLHYRANVQVVGVSLEGFFRDSGLGTSGEGDKAGGREPEGEIYGRLTLAGNRDDPQSRVGRGHVRVLGAHLASVPLMLRMVHLFQFTLAVSDSLHYADADFFVAGDRLVFERILFESTFGDNALLQLYGEGEMDFNTFELDTRFRTRGGVLLIRDIAGALSDQLYVIEVTGTLSDPKPRVIPASAAKEWISLGEPFE